MKTLLLALLLAGSCLAQTQQEMNRQAAADFAKADRELNVVYKQLMGELSQQAEKDKLIAAEQLWIKLRDADAAARAQEFEGGSIYPMIYDGSRTASTLERTRWLREWYEELKSR